MAGRIHVVVGGEFGSEGKGALCARLADTLAPNSLVIRTGGPNAGHTAYDPEGRRFQLRMLGTPAVRRDDIMVALAPRSVVDLDVLADETHQVRKMAYVDPNATILTPDDIEAEQNPDDLQTGSTRKGIGAARKRRLDRTGYSFARWQDDGLPVPSSVIGYEPVPDLARGVLANGGDVLIEAAQGYGLGLHTSYYPHTTSADCTVMDALTDCHFTLADLSNNAVSPWVVIRPFPIRIAGASGPLEHETTWEALGLPEEYTTVTKKVRRVGDWDPDLVEAAIESAGGASIANVCLTMVDQVFPALAGATTHDEIQAKLGDEGYRRFIAWVNQLRDSVGSNFSVDAIGTGPETMVLVRETVAEMMSE